MMNRRDEIEDSLADENPEAVFFDGLEDACLGVGRQFTKPGLVVYSLQKMIDHFMEDGMTHEEAQEFIDFNVAGLWAGDGTPIILDDLE